MRTAGKLLAVQMKRRGEEEEERRRVDKDRAARGLSGVGDEDEDVVKEGQDIVYVSEMGMDASERAQNRTTKFRKTDAYHLPELSNGIEGMGKPDDPRIMSAEELEEYARQFNNGEDVNFYDFSKIDFNGEFFMSLPAGDRYNILNAARLRSRLRMGLSKEQLEEMFPDRMAFSRFQIERVRERNELTQRLMNLNGMNADLAGVGVGSGRIAGERGREYVLVKNDGVEGGWALGVVNTENKDLGERNKPIDIDALTQRARKIEESEEEDEFEDVPVEGLNRLPKRKRGSEQNMTYEEYQAREMANARRELYASREEQRPAKRVMSEQPDSLFVDDDNGGPSNSRSFELDDEDGDLNRAIALSMQQDDDAEDEEEHLNRAIALSMQKNHREESDPDDEDIFEDVPMPEFKQQAVAAPQAIKTSNAKDIAHIVNNRANAAVPKSKPKPATIVESDSDSDVDMSAALAKARKQKAPERRKPAPVVTNTKNPFDGPLPFERLDLGGSIFSQGKKKEQPKKPVDEGEEVEMGDGAGGFDNSLEDDAPKPIPPWLVGDGDIRNQVDKQRQRDQETNAEDRQRALEEEMRFREANKPIEIESSDEEDDDVQIVDAPPPKPREKTKTPEIVENFGDVAEEVRAQPPVTSMPDDMQPSIEPARSLQRSHDVEFEKPDEKDDEAEWSESDYGDVTIKSGKTVNTKHPAGGRTDKAPSKSASPEFEDVEMSKPATPPRQPSPSSRNAAEPDTSAEFPQRALQSEESFARQLAQDPEFDDEFSDPEDEELIAQLAIEAEEHARFAKELNHNKTVAQNAEDYERELKALRNQQKKDRRDADEVSHIMITECQALLRLFGLPYITAPMEAEAQCAELVRLGLVDGVVTDDCDIFLFGGTRVYKNMFNSNKFVECYLLADIEKELSLTRDQLIAIAHLLGSDYTDGLPGVGPVTALEIISEFPDGLEEFKNWWGDVQSQLTISHTTEPTKFRKKFRKSQAAKLFLPPAFPSQAVTDAYWNPEVDSTPEPFQWGVPDLDRLREFLMATIGWSQERTDEVLVPVIRDMNRRETEGTQANITRYFEGVVGAGAGEVRGQGATGSSRMRDAVGKLKAKRNKGKGLLDRTFGDEAREWAEKNDIGWTEKEQEKLRKGKGWKGGKRAPKKQTAVAVANEDDGGDTAAVDQDVGEDRQEADDDDSDDFVETASNTRSKGKGKASGEEGNEKRKAPVRKKAKT